MSSTSSSRMSATALAVLFLGERGGLRLFLGNEHLAVGPVPGRDLMAPPQLARDAPGLDVLHPMEVGVLPVLGHEHGAAALHGVDGGLRQGLGVDIPLVGEERLDDHVRAVAVRHGVDVRLDLFDQTLLFEPRNDGLARGEAVQPVQFLNRQSQLRTRRNTLGEVRIAIEQELCFRTQDVDLRQRVALARPRSR